MGLAPESIEVLKSLPPTLMLDLPQGKLLLCHGVGSNDMQRLGPDDSGYAISANEDLLTGTPDPEIAVALLVHRDQALFEDA